MNRKVFAAALGAFLAGGVALAQEQAPMGKPGAASEASTSDTMKGHEHTFVGVVRAYQPGKKLTVSIGKRTQSFVLDSKSLSATIDPSIAVGQKVKVVETRGDDGAKTLTVHPAG